MEGRNRRRAERMLMRESLREMSREMNRDRKRTVFERVGTNMLGSTMEGAFLCTLMLGAIALLGSVGRQ